MVIAYEKPKQIDSWKIGERREKEETSMRGFHVGWRGREMKIA